MYYAVVKYRNGYSSNSGFSSIQSAEGVYILKGKTEKQIEARVEKLQNEDRAFDTGNRAHRWAHHKIESIFCCPKRARYEVDVLETPGWVEPNEWPQPPACGCVECADVRKSLETWRRKEINN